MPKYVTRELGHLPTLIGERLLPESVDPWTLLTGKGAQTRESPEIVTRPSHCRDGNCYKILDQGRHTLSVKVSEGNSLGFMGHYNLFLAAQLHSAAQKQSCTIQMSMVVSQYNFIYGH